MDLFDVAFMKYAEITFTLQLRGNVTNAILVNSSVIASEIFSPTNYLCGPTDE